MRPPSIVTFERLYLGALALGLAGSALGWRHYTHRLAENPQTAAVAGWYLPVWVGLSTLITLVLWYFIARRASVVAKWIMVAVTALAALFALAPLFALVAGQADGEVLTAITLATRVLQVAAAVMLFRPDARGWFGEDAAADGAADEVAE